jgi:hypothetical protein
VLSAPVAQLDRANASGALGREFESLRARQKTHPPQHNPDPLYGSFRLVLGVSM